MASAHFFAEFEIAIRNAVPATGRYRSGAYGIRPFGGLNVLGFGDMYQLACPEGLPLYTIHSMLLGDAATREDTPLVARGLDLLWVKTNCEGFHKVVDLHQPFRCTDEWWNSVLDEFRFLQLKSDTHAFLHGEETTLPGSWLAGKASCQNLKVLRIYQLTGKNYK